jgi:hypothetical protein
MKIHSLRGSKEVPDPAGGPDFVTDDNDDVEVPDELGERLLEQVDAWAPVKGQKPQPKPAPVIDEEG